MRINILRNLLIIVTMSLLVGCGGGSSFTPTNPDDNTTIPDNNGTTPDDNGTVPDDNGTTPDDNGTTPDDNETVLSKGTATASKGPFRAGALVTAYRLDEQLQRTGEYKETNTTDDKGTFIIELSWTGLTEINVVGDYYNELTGAYMCDGNLSTFVYMQGDGDNPVGVNVATHMLHEMMKKKVEEGNTSDYEDIEREAEAMLKEFFGLDDNLSLGELNITDDGRESRQLLALSLAIASSDNPNELMGELSVDIADDGEVNDEGQGAYQELQEGFRDIDKKIEEAVENMQNDINGIKATKTSSALDGTIISTTIDFEKVNSAYLDTNYTSNEVTIDGIIGDEAVMKLKSGEVYYRLNGADPVLLTEDASVMVTNGDLLSLQAISASTYETRTVTKIEIGGKTFKFVIKTMKDPFVADDEPDDFDFGFISDAKVGQDYESSIVVSGINVASPISIEDGEYSIDGGAFTAADGTVENDDNVTVRLTASDDFGDKTKAIVTIGGVKGKFFVKTERKDNTPDEMIFAPVVGADKSEVVESAAVKVEGINTEVTAKIKNGKLSVNGGNYVTEAQVNDGDTIKLQVTAPSSYDASKEYIVRVGRISASFEVQTMSNPVVPDTTPDAFSFGAKSVDTAGMDVFSDVITVASINQEVDIEVSGGSYKINTGSFTSTKGKVKVGDQVQLKVTAPDYGKETTATLTIGGVNGAFTVSTTKDDTPDSGVAFTTQTNVDRDIDIESNAIKITGINVPIPVVVDGGEVSINGGAYTTSGNVSNNQTLKVKLRSSAKANDFSLALVSVGTGLNLPFVVKTKAAKPVFGTVPTLNATEDAEFKAELLPYLTEGVSTQWSISGNPAWLMINPLNGRLFGTPKGDASVGTYTVTVTAVNGSGQGSVTFDVEVANVNYAPVLTTTLPDKSVNEDSKPFSIALTSTDQDSLDHAVFSATSSNTNLAKVSVSGSQLTVTPVANANGKVNITVTVTDDFGAKASKTFALTINPVNDAPVLDAIANQTVAEDGVVPTIILNATDVDTGDTLTYKATSLDTSKATVSVNGNKLTITSVANANGVVSIDVYANDGTVNSNKQTFSLTITPVNDAPVGKADSKTTAEDTAATISLLANDSDVDGDSLTVTNLSTPSHGILVNNGNGTVTYTPAENFNGTDSFTYTPNDGTVDGNVVTVAITVTAVNDTPVLDAIDDQTVAEDDTLPAITLNATDVDTGDTLTYKATSLDTSKATVSVSGNQLTVTPVADANGVVSIEVYANDGKVDSNKQTFSLTITPVNDAPVGKVDSKTTAEDTASTIDLLSNDSDVDGDSLTVTNLGTPSHGTLDDNGDGTVTYTPAANYNGSDSFTYTPNDGTVDGTSVTVTITVTAVNDTPVGTADTATTDEDSAVDINVVANDSDVDDGDTLVATNVSTPVNGTVVNKGNGVLTYTPAENFNGTDSFTYTPNDGTIDGDPVTVTVTITAVNDAPVGGADTATTNEDTAVDINLLSNDTDVEGETLSVTNLGTPSHGTLTDNGDGTVTYTPAANYNGSDSFTYTPNDGTVDGASVTVSITVTAVNDAPVGTADAATTNEDTAVDINVVVNDSDVDDGDTLVATNVSTPANGTVVNKGNGVLTYTPAQDFNGTDSFTYTPNDGTVDGAAVTVTVTVNAVNDAPVGGADTATTDEDTAVDINLLINDTDVEHDTLSVTNLGTPSHGTLDDNGDGTVTYTPAANYNGSDSFTYTPNDGTVDGASVTVSITVTAVNDTPVGTADAATTNEDTAVDIDLISNDSDVDGDSLSVTNLGSASNGTLTDKGNGTVTYTPAANFNGTDSFTYTPNDGTVDGDAVTVTVTVNAVNDVPVGIADTATTDEDTPVSINLTLNDTDVEGETLSVTNLSIPANGTVANNGGGMVTYTPAANFNGTDSFTYTPNDGTDNGASVTVTVTVNAVNDTPVLSVNMPAAIEQDRPLSVQATVTDPDLNDANSQEVHTFSLSGQPAWMSISSTGLITGTPTNADIGITTDINLTVTDKAGLSDSYVFDFEVKDKNDIPTITGTPETTAVVGTEYRFTPVGDDADANDVLTFTISNQPEWLEFNESTGELYGVPMFLDIGTSDPITISVTDDINTTSLSAFTITVTDETDIQPMAVTLPVDLYELDDNKDASFGYGKVALGEDNVMTYTGYSLDENGSFAQRESGFVLRNGEWQPESDGQEFRVLDNFIDLYGENSRVAMTAATPLEGQMIELPELNVTMPADAMKYTLTIRSYGEQYNINNVAHNYETGATYTTLDGFIADKCEQQWIVSANGDNTVGLVMASGDAAGCSSTEGPLVETSSSQMAPEIATAGYWVRKEVNGIEMLVIYPTDPKYQDGENQFRMFTVFDGGEGDLVWEGDEEQYDGSPFEIEMYNDVAIEAIKQKVVDKALGIVARFTPEMLSDTGRVWNVFPESNDTTGEHWYEAATFEFTSTSLQAQLGIVNPIDTPLVEADYDITDRGQLHFVDSEDGSENYITIVGLTEQNMTVCWSDTAVPECSEDELEFIYFDQGVAQTVLDQMNQNSVLLPDGFVYGVINNKAIVQETSVIADNINYHIKLYADYEEVADLQQNHKAVRVTVNGVQSSNMSIQNTYGNHNIVAAIYVDGRLVKTSAPTLVNPAAPGVSITVDVP